MKIKVQVDINNSITIKKWIIKDPDSPWIINPDNNQDKTMCDIVFDGMDITTDQSNQIKDIGFTMSLINVPKFTTTENNVHNIGSVSILEKGYIQAMDFGDQDIFYDEENKALKWQYNSNKEDQFVKIAENVIVGIRENHLQSIIVNI